ncbi:MAG: VOC family protein [Oscillospiraceae bacterium]|nr:VOC family protein [Oscillospiraceae bacterium]
MKIDHIGYAVKNIDKAKKAMKVLGYDFGDVIEDTDRGIYISFGTKDALCIELVAPIDVKAGNSPVSNLLSKAGPTPYHICYHSDDLEADVSFLEADGFRLLIPPAPAVAFGGKRVVFMFSVDIGLIEIVE